MRKAAQFTGVAAIAALLLSGCGSSGERGKDAGTPSTSPKSTPSAPTGGDGKAAQPGAVEGAWKSGSSASPLVLVVAKGTAAFSKGHQSACMGKVEKMGGATMAVLKCTDGSTSHTMGVLEPGADGKTLTVKWKGGPTEHYTKADDGSVKVPEMPKLPEMPKS
ncbi:hypothetical protein ACFC0M_37015 [Streptomyces sp. NPDC056149]|uniref:hypothetical protein n=1 Tax=Streptomyces sp. NPDC056149 TaxID=3345728 RepID=UPI0035DC8771